MHTCVVHCITQFCHPPFCLPFGLSPPASAEAMAAAKDAQNKMYAALTVKRASLEHQLEQKLLRYRDILKKEMVWTASV